MGHSAWMAWHLGCLWSEPIWHFSCRHNTIICIICVFVQILYPDYVNVSSVKYCHAQLFCSTMSALWDSESHTACYLNKTCCIRRVQACKLYELVLRFMSLDGLFTTVSRALDCQGRCSAWALHIRAGPFYTTSTLVWSFRSYACTYCFISYVSGVCLPFCRFWGGSKLSVIHLNSCTLIVPVFASPLFMSMTVLSRVHANWSNQWECLILFTNCEKKIESCGDSIINKKTIITSLTVFQMQDTLTKTHHQHSLATIGLFQILCTKQHLKSCHQRL